jgi:hypothetical protein
MRHLSCRHTRGEARIFMFPPRKSSEDNIDPSCTNIISGKLNQKLYIQREVRIMARISEHIFLKNSLSCERGRRHKTWDQVSVGVCMFVSSITVYIGSCLRLDTEAINRELAPIFQVEAQFIRPTRQGIMTLPPPLGDNSKWKSQGKKYNVCRSH